MAMHGANLSEEDPLAKKKVAPFEVKLGETATDLLILSLSE